MSWQARCEGLSPGLRRGLVLAGGALGILAVAVLLVSTPEQKGTAPTERQRLVQNLLTDADPRALGMDGLAGRLGQLEGRIDQLSAGLDKLGVIKQDNPERDALIEGVRAEQARQLEALRAEQQALREQLETVRRAPGERGPDKTQPGRPREPERPATPVERPPEKPLA